MVSGGSRQGCSKKGETRAEGREEPGRRGFQQAQPSSFDGVQIWTGRTWTSQACRTSPMGAPKGSGGASQRVSSGPQQHACPESPYTPQREDGRHPSADPGDPLVGHASAPWPISRPARSRIRTMAIRCFTTDSRGRTINPFGGNEFPAAWQTKDNVRQTILTYAIPWSIISP